MSFLLLRFLLSLLVTIPVVITSNVISAAVIFAVVNSCGFPVRPDATRARRPQMLKADANSNRRRPEDSRAGRRSTSKPRLLEESFGRPRSLRLCPSRPTFLLYFLLLCMFVALYSVIWFSSCSLLFAPVSYPTPTCLYVSLSYICQCLVIIPFIFLSLMHLLVWSSHYYPYCCYCTQHIPLFFLQGRFLLDSV